MGMDLEAKKYQTEPDYFIAGEGTVETAIKTAAEALEAHTPVTIAEGKVSAVKAKDGAAVTTGLYGITADSAAAEETVPIYLTGAFFAEGLVLSEGITADALEVPFRNIGIFLK